MGAVSTAFQSPAAVVTTSVIEPPYQEFPPSPKFAAHIECFWSHRTDGPVRNFHVFPDGCADIIFEQPARDYGGLAIVGTMTRAQAFDIPARPFNLWRALPTGHGGAALARAGHQSPWINPFRLLTRGKRRRFASFSTIWRAAVRRAMQSLGSRRRSPTLRRSIRWRERLRGSRNADGQVSMDALADAASLSPRQFRRICLERTGLSPKHLARVLRFRQGREGCERAAAGLGGRCGRVRLLRPGAPHQRIQGTRRSFARAVFVALPLPLTSVRNLRPLGFRPQNVRFFQSSPRRFPLGCAAMRTLLAVALLTTGLLSGQNAAANKGRTQK